MATRINGGNGGGLSRIFAMANKFRFLLLTVSSTVACYLMLMLSGAPTPLESDLAWASRRTPSQDSFTIATDGCTIPGLHAFDPLVARFIQPPKQNSCEISSNVLHNNATHIWVNNLLELEKSFACCYRAFYRPSSIPDIYSINVDDRVKYDRCVYFNDVIEATDEFVRVTCKHNNSVIHDQFFLFAIVKPFIPLEKNDVTETPNNNTAYNVLILGIDAVSRLNFHRTMPKTLHFLRKRGAIELFGYNKVGDNTFPNVVPLLLGIRDTELKKTCWRNWRTSFDNCPFVWDAYRDAGYLTALGEDSANLGTFNFQKIGFYTNPTNYYLHTFIHECEKHVGNNKDFNSFLCMGQQYFFKMLLDYIEQLTEVLSDSKLFGFFWEVTMSHDYVNYPLTMDEHYEAFLLRLHESGYLDKTVVILVSDHGIRWGPMRLTKQGRIEERLPMMHILMPKSFRQDYRVAYNNLKLNSHRLTTPFDVHATLSDLIDLSVLQDSEITSRSQENYADQRSISLFLPVPKNRTCKMADIDDHWCTCHVSVRIDPSSTEVRVVATFVISYLNKLVGRHKQCARLNVSEIVEVSEMVVGTPNKDEVGWREYLVVVRAVPGAGLFEATVRQHTHGALALAGTVSRLNLYGEQSRCIHDYNLKLYCFCR